jgi:hypothetical protein
MSGAAAGSVERMGVRFPERFHGLALVPARAIAGGRSQRLRREGNGEMPLRKRLAVGLGSVVLLAGVAGAGSASEVPWIKGNLVVHPNGPIDPGQTTLTFDANITGASSGTTWNIALTVPPYNSWGPGGFKTVPRAPAYLANFLGAYKVPCIMGQASRVCFELYAYMAVGPEVTLGTVCLPVKPYVGPSHAQLTVEAPLPIRPGTVLHFAAKIPREDCGHLYRVVRSPIDAPNAWSTGWRVGCPSTPAVAFPKTFEVPLFGRRTAGVAPVGNGQLCFVLEDQDQTYFPVDKWCWQPLAQVARPPVTVGHLGLPTPTPGPLRGRVSSLAGTHGSSLQRVPAAAVHPEPDLVVKFQKGPLTGLEILNQGQGAAGPSEVRFSKPGIAPTLVPVQTLAPGAFLWISIPQDHEELMLYTGGGTVTADALHQVAESNETNNTYVWTWKPPQQ